MTKHSDALRLADCLTRGDSGYNRQAAAELRRLEADVKHKLVGIKFLWKECDDLGAVNAQLLESLKYVLEDDGLIPRATAETRAVVRAAISKATGETK